MSYQLPTVGNRILNIPLTTLLSRGRLEEIYVSDTRTAAAAYAGILFVPRNEVWLLHSFTLNCTRDTAANWTALNVNVERFSPLTENIVVTTLCYLKAPEGLNVQLNYPNTQGVVGGDVVIQNAVPFVLFPGSWIVVGMVQSASGILMVSGVFLVQRIPLQPGELS